MSNISVAVKFERSDGQSSDRDGDTPCIASQTVESHEASTSGPVRNSSRDMLDVMEISVFSGDTRSENTRPLQSFHEISDTYDSDADDVESVIIPWTSSSKTGRSQRAGAGKENLLCCPTKMDEFCRADVMERARDMPVRGSRDGTCAGSQRNEHNNVFLSRTSAKVCSSQDCFCPGFPNWVEDNSHCKDSTRMQTELSIDAGVCSRYSRQILPSEEWSTSICRKLCKVVIPSMSMHGEEMQNCTGSRGFVSSAFDPDEAPSPSCSPPVSSSGSGGNDSEFFLPSESLIKFSKSARTLIVEDFNPTAQDSDSDTSHVSVPSLPAAESRDLCDSQLRHSGIASGSDVQENVRISESCRQEPLSCNTMFETEKMNDARNLSGTCTDDGVSQSSRTPRYFHVLSFDYVCSEVLRKYRRILANENIILVERVKHQLSSNAKALFVRLYRRKHSWHSVLALQHAYQNIEIRSAVDELMNFNLLRSTLHLQTSSNWMAKFRACKRVLRMMNLDELRNICSVLVDGKRLQSQTRANILSVLLRIVSQEHRCHRRSGYCGSRGEQYSEQFLLQANIAKRRRSFRQSTIDGSVPATNIAKAAFQKERVRLPQYVIRQFQRMHSLFFFDDGHDSPNIILVDSGILKVPRYACIPKSEPFPSKRMFEEYESARRLLSAITASVDEKVWQPALHLGAVAEVELRRYVCARMRTSGDVSSVDCEYQHGERNIPDKASPCKRKTCSSLHIQRFDQSGVLGYCVEDLKDMEDEAQQLLHPFFRRFAPVWIYALGCWRSVRALETQKEHETAVKRLYLLLESRLLCNYRGKFADRLTINLSHLGREEEGLNVIVTTLRDPRSQLHRGEIAALASRGVRFHKRRQRSVLKPARKKSAANRGERSHILKDANMDGIPDAIEKALASLKTAVPVRMLRAICSPTFRETVVPGNELAPLAEDMRYRDTDSMPTDFEEETRDVGVKSKFIGLSDATLSVSVEELALQWYRAHSQWRGQHSEGRAVRFLWSILFWDCAIYADVPDAFQTRYQRAPWDLSSEAFYSNRRIPIDSRLAEIRVMRSNELEREIRACYSSEGHYGIQGVCVDWDSFSEDDMACIGVGLGAKGVARICELLCKDFAYWSGGLPDLVLWKWDWSSSCLDLEKRICKVDSEEGCDETRKPVYRAKLVEVKSQRDSLATRQRAWLAELLDAGCDCEVFKVVERATKRNAAKLRDSELDASQLALLDLDQVAGPDP